MIREHKNIDFLINEVIDKLFDKNKQNEIQRILDGNIEEEIRLTEELYDLSKVENGFGFEEYIGRLYEKLGYIVKITKKSGDQGADIVIEKDNVKKVVQTKFYTQPVGNTAIQEIVASISFYGASSGIVVTNNTFTKAAIELAKKNQVELIDKYQLDKMINEISKSNLVTV